MEYRTIKSGFSSSIYPKDIKNGDIITLNDGLRGKVFDDGQVARYILFGHHGRFRFSSRAVVKVERRNIRRVRIYQIDPLDSKYAFRDYANVRAQGRAAPPAELYKVVFDGQLETDALRDIWRIFNTSHPQGYLGRSLSVSDIVELYDSTGSRFFYCDSFCFKKIRFNPVTSRFMLISFEEREMSEPQMFSDLPKAQKQMKAELLQWLGNIEDYEAGEDYGLTDFGAWANPRANRDWRIIRITADTRARVNAALYQGDTEVCHGI